MRKLDSIQALRGIAALAVVVYHIGALSLEHGNGELYVPAVSLLKGGVDLFFVISGFIMVASTYDRFDETGAARRFAVHRIARIYPPYWVLTFIVMLYWLRNPNGVNADHGGIDLLSSWLLTPSDKYPLVSVGWTLIYEISFYAVFFLFLLLPRRRLGSALVGWATIVIASYGALRVSGQWNGPWLRTFLGPYTLEFIGGCFVGLAWHKRTMPLPSAALASGVAILAVVATGLQLTSAPDGLDVGFRTLLYGPAAALIVYGASGQETRGARAPALLARLGDMSYSLYLIHLLLLQVYYRGIWPRLDFVGAPWVSAAAMLTISVAGGVLFYGLVERPSTRWFKHVLKSLTAARGRTVTAPSAPTASIK